VLQVTRPIPITAWLPLSIMWFGLGHRATASDLHGGLLSHPHQHHHGREVVDRRLIEAAQMLGTRRRQLFYRVLLRARCPRSSPGCASASVSRGCAWWWGR
jgi:ABC-type nitrate/sulfonate/bicarbonate transport system permease component